MTLDPNWSDPKTSLEPPYFLDSLDGRGNIYYHYTSYARFCLIRRNYVLQASNKDEDGNEKPSLCRIYVTDVAPYRFRKHPLVWSRAIFGRVRYITARSQKKIDYCVALNMSKLPIVGSRRKSHVFYVENIPFLPLKYNHDGTRWFRLVAHGKTKVF